jgi:hypothetical protein
MDYDINGPINFIKLEHNKKIIYVFIDMWVDYTNLTDCSLISNPLNKSIDIDQFLINFLKNTNENIDFFLPIYKKKEKKINNKKEIYIYQVCKLPKKINNKNIDFIYKEFRNKYVQKLYNIAYKYNIFFTVYNYDIDNIIFDMKKILKYIKKIMKITINLKFDFNIKNFFTDLQKNISELINLLESNKDNLVYGINEKKFIELQSKIYNLLYIITNSVKLIDVILYNTFIINSIFKNNNKTIIYFPYDWGFNLIHILIKYFDFKITNRFFSDPFIDNESIEKLNKIIGKLDMDYESLLFMEKIFIYKNKDDNIIQCINFINLPRLT